MQRILIASVAVLGFVGVAAAQQTPMLQGDYSANVLNSYNGAVEPAPATATGNIDFSSTASIGQHSMHVEHSSKPVTDGFNYSR